MRNLLFLSFVLCLTLCSKDDTSTDNQLIAAFTHSGGDMPAPHRVVFANTSTNATSYLWNFGNGDQSVMPNPTYVYQEAGTYTVSLTAYQDNQQKTASQTLVVYDRYDQVKMNRLTLIEYPETNSGAGWDDDGPPDVFFRITNYIGTVLYSSEVINDLPVAGLPVTYSRDLPYTYPDLNAVNVIKFYDYDDSLSINYMGGYYFTMKLYVAEDGSGYPTELEFNSPGSPVKFRLAVEWTYSSR